MDGVILSASRDATVQVWKKTSQRLPRYESTLSSHSSSFVNALAFFPPNAEFPQGLIVSGGKDAIIEARQPDKAPEDNAEALMPGHSNNVCALDVSSAGGYIVSGSWDGKARIWKIGKWECEVELSSHEGAVWAVLAFDEDTVITGILLLIS